MLPSKEPNVKRLQALFSCNAKLGKLYWKVRPSANSYVHAGDEAGHLEQYHGYIRVSISDRRYRVHRILWILYTGKPIPDGMFIDHINGNRGDNRRKNLRIATARSNQQNRCDQREFHNISKRPSGKFRVQINIGGVNTCCGQFETVEAAVIARDKILCSKKLKTARAKPNRVPSKRKR
jgi:hypothetical protein